MCSLAPICPIPQSLPLLISWHIIYPNSRSSASSYLLLSLLSKNRKDSSSQLHLHTDFTQQPATLSTLVQVTLMSVSETVCFPMGVCVSTPAVFTRFPQTDGNRYKLPLWVLITPNLHFKLWVTNFSVISLFPLPLSSHTVPLLFPEHIKLILSSGGMASPSLLLNGFDIQPSHDVSSLNSSLHTKVTFSKRSAVTILAKTASASLLLYSTLVHTPPFFFFTATHTHRQTHRHIHIYIYMLDI